MPNTHGSPLASAMSYYSHIVTVNAEGDSNVSEDTLEGLGTKGLLLHALFGSILRLAQPPPSPHTSLNTPGSNPTKTPSNSSNRRQPRFHQNRTDARDDEMAAALACYPKAAAGSTTRAAAATTGAIRNSTSAQTQVAADDTFAGTYRQHSDVDFLNIDDCDPDSQLSYSQRTSNGEEDASEQRLMSLLPEPGYYLAGAISGGISRTATAPIDRLKVYLLVDNKSKTNTVIAAAKAGSVVAAARSAGTPVTEAIRDLYKTGGLRTFFAGRNISPRPLTITPAAPWDRDTSSLVIQTNTVHRQRAKCHQDNARDGNQGIWATPTRWQCQSLTFKL